MASRAQTRQEFLDEIIERYGAEIEELDWEDAWDVFDRQSQFALGMSGEEFLNRWDAGEMKDPDLHVRVQMVVGALPLVVCEWPNRFGG